MSVRPPSRPQQMKKITKERPHPLTPLLHQAATCQACDSVRPQKGINYCITEDATREISYRLHC